MHCGVSWGLVLVVVGAMACTSAGTVKDDPVPPPSAPEVVAPPAASTPPPPAVTEVVNVTVQMTAATLADECGGAPPAPAAKEKSKAKRDSALRRTACEQSSMQLSVVAAAGSAETQVAVKKVELFDDTGALIGALTPGTPSVWGADGTYQAWDEKVGAGQELSVSYALSEPPWQNVPDRFNQTYVLKAVITVGSGDQAVQRDVRVAAPTSLPPNVKT